MYFNSLPFALFIVPLWLVYWLANGIKIRHWILLLASLLFYGWWDWRFLPLMIGIGSISWFAALLISDNRNEQSRIRAKWAWILGVGLPVSALLFFKYTPFICSTIQNLTRLLGHETNIGNYNILLPVGISFYTFQAISYIMDVKRGRCAAENSLSRVMLYIAFFPQLVAGPIVAAADFLPQLHNPKYFDISQFFHGSRKMLMGLLLKVVFADSLATWADAVFNAPMSFTLIGRWLGAVAFYGQIYFDFAGYSLMAIGAAATFGYSLLDNFRVPYAATSISDFWRRWHISLSTWLKDYIFIPLGGNRSHNYRNLMLTMLLGGLWHGASITFLLWGALHGFALCLSKAAASCTCFKITNSPLMILISWLATQAFVLTCWIPFRAQNWSTVGTFFSTATNDLQQLLPSKDTVLITWPWLIIPLVTDAFLQRQDAKDLSKGGRGYEGLVGVLLIACLIVILSAGTWKKMQFIYFQF